MVNGKRPHELLILKLLLESEYVSKKQLEEILLKEYDICHDFNSIESAIQLLQGKFINTQREKEKYKSLSCIRENQGMCQRMLQYYAMIKHGEFKKQISDLLELGLLRYRDIYIEKDGEDNLALYQKYSRKDICRLLNWGKDDSSTIYGYKIKNKTCPIFVTYKKEENITNSTKYADHFISKKKFSWMTRSRVHVNSKEAQALIHTKEDHLKIYLFVKKSDGEGSDFYYLGKVCPVEWRETTILNDKGKELPIMNFQMELEHMVREDIYDYLVN